MLTPEELLAIVETMYPLLDELNDWITADLVKRLLARLAQGEAFLTATDDWQIQVYQEAGGHLEALQRELARWTKLCDKEIQRIFEDAGIRALKRDGAFYKAQGLESTPLTQSESMLRLLEDSYQRTAGTVHNFTRTTATASQQRFIKLLDKAHFLVNSGAASYTRVVEEVTKELVNEQTKVHYPSGHVDTIETAVLRAVRTGVGQASGNMALEGMLEHDWDIILVSAHLGARYGDGGENPGNHFWWQGKFYSRTGRTPDLPDFIKCTGYGTGEGLCGWNCRHNFGPGDGVFNPYKTYDNEKNRQVYDLSQKQRTMEARIRRTKAKLAGLREAGMDEEYSKAARLLGRQNEAYQEFCRENDLRPLMERIQVAQWTREDARRSIIETKNYVEKYSHYHYNEDGTIVVTDDWSKRTKPSVSWQYKPYAVVQTETAYRNGTRQSDRTIYGADGRMDRQIHSGPHNRPDKHRFGNHGEHGHSYTWSEDGKLIRRTTRELTEDERRENADILGGDANA